MAPWPLAPTINGLISISSSVSLWANALIILGAISVVFLVLFILRKSLIVPLAQINSHLSLLAAGNFRQSLHFSGSGELWRLSLSIQQVQHSIVEVITAVQSALVKGEQR